MSKTKPPKTSAPQQDDGELQGRAAYGFRSVPGFDDFTRKIGPANAAEVAVFIQEFEREWLRGVPDRELNSRFDYKLLHGEARKQGVRQIRCGNYRVALLVLDSELTVWRLLVFDRKDDAKSIRLAAERAQSKRRGMR